MPRVAFVLIIAAGLASAFAPGQCPSSYCENGVLSRECYYAQSDYTCKCTTMRGCEFGCNASDALDPSCNAEPVSDARCPNQCYDDKFYQSWWSDAAQSCMSQLLATCPFGCNANHSRCADAPAATPLQSPTPSTGPTAAPTPAPPPPSPGEFDGMTWGELRALGIPVRCAYRNESFLNTSIVYDIKGDRSRIAYSSAFTLNRTLTVVRNGTTDYLLADENVLRSLFLVGPMLSANNSQYLAPVLSGLTCEWVRYGDQTDASPSASNFSRPDAGTVCNRASFGDDVFDVNGKVCSESELERQVIDVLNATILGVTPTPVPGGGLSSLCAPATGVVLLAFAYAANRRG